MKKGFFAILIVSGLARLACTSLHPEMQALQPAPIKIMQSLRLIEDPLPLPIQGAPFQPMLLAFDRKTSRLFAATPDTASSGTSLIVFQNPESEGPAQERIFTLSGVSSGLSFDSEGQTLFISNATKHEITIFDRIDSNRIRTPSRRLERFNFPTGIGFDRASNRLFVADAHPGAVLVFEGMDTVQGPARPALTLGGETGLNGPFAVLIDKQRGRVYVSNFDGVFAFRLDDLSAPPLRLPLPKGTLARGLAIDPQSGRLYIAAPMRRSYFVFDGESLEESQLQGVSGAFPFSLALDSKKDRLYLAGTDPKIGVIDRASGSHIPRQGPGEKRRSIDRWIPLDHSPTPEPPGQPRPSPPAPFHPSPPNPPPHKAQPEGPSTIHFRRPPSSQTNRPIIAPSKRATSSYR